MKRNIIFLLTLMTFCLSYAQSDSIALSQISELGVYYVQNGNAVNIEPIMQIGTKGSAGLFAGKGSQIYEGENSDNVLENPIELYVYIPKEYQSKIYIKQFKMVTLTAKKGERTLVISTLNPGSARTGANIISLKHTKLSEECFKVYLDTPLEKGHYGIFYDYSGRIPMKLYDFDIR